MWHIWVRSVLGDVAFFELLLEIDRELLEEARSGPCPHCGGRLHRGNYERKPRGEPAGLPATFSTRFSLCCSHCRRRVTPFSVRFLARRVYVGAAVVLVAAAMQGPSPARLKRLCELFGMAARTAKRWLAWWQTAFASSDLFKSLRGLMQRAIPAEQLPLGLLELLHRGRPVEAALAALRLLAPITSSSAPGAQPV